MGSCSSASLIRKVHPLESVAASSEKRTDDNVVSILRIKSEGITLERLQQSLDVVWNKRSSLRVFIKPGKYISKLYRQEVLPAKAQHLSVKSFETLSDTLCDMVYGCNKGYGANLLVGLADIEEDLRLGPYELSHKNASSYVYVYVASAHSFHDGKSHALILKDIVSHMVGLPLEPRRDDNKTPIELHTNPVNEFKIQFKGFPMPGFARDFNTVPCHKKDLEELHPFMRPTDIGWDNFLILKKKCAEHNVSTAAFYHALMLMTAKRMSDTETFNNTSMAAFDFRRSYAKDEHDRFGMHVVMPAFTLDVKEDDSIWTVAQILKAEYTEADSMLKASCPVNIKHWKEGDAQTSTMSRGFEMGGILASSPGYHLFPEALIEAAGISGYWAWSAFNTFFTTGLWSCGVPNQSSVLILSVSRVLYTEERANDIHKSLHQILKEVLKS